MFSLIVLSIFVIDAAFGSQSANQYIDNVLQNSLQSVIRNEKLDSTSLPNFDFEYHDKTWMGKVKGRAEYEEGQITGLSKVRRFSECGGPSYSMGALKLNCTLSFDDLHTSYKGKVKYGVLPKVSINAKGDIGPTIVFVDIVQEQHQQKASVKSLTFRQVGNVVNTQLTGLGPLNKYMKILEDNYNSRVSAFVASLIGSRFQQALSSAVGYVPMPKP